MKKRCLAMALSLFLSLQVMSVPVMASEDTAVQGSSSELADASTADTGSLAAQPDDASSSEVSEANDSLSTEPATGNVDSEGDAEDLSETADEVSENAGIDEDDPSVNSEDESLEEVSDSAENKSTEDDITSFSEDTNELYYHIEAPQEQKVYGFGDSISPLFFRMVNKEGMLYYNEDVFAGYKVLVTYEDGSQNIFVPNHDYADWFVEDINVKPGETVTVTIVENESSEPDPLLKPVSVHYVQEYIQDESQRAIPFAEGTLNLYVFASFFTCGEDASSASIPKAQLAVSGSGIPITTAKRVYSNFSDHYIPRVCGEYGREISSISRCNYSFTNWDKAYLEPGMYDMLLTFEDGHTEVCENIVNVTNDAIIFEFAQNLVGYTNNYLDSYDQNGDSVYLELDGWNVDPSKLHFTAVNENGIELPISYDGTVDCFAIPDTYSNIFILKLKKGEGWPDSINGIRLTLSAVSGYTFTATGNVSYSGEYNSELNTITVTLSDKEQNIYSAAYNYQKNALEFYYTRDIPAGTRITAKYKVVQNNPEDNTEYAEVEYDTDKDITRGQAIVIPLIKNDGQTVMVPSPSTSGDGTFSVDITIGDDEYDGIAVSLGNGMPNYQDLSAKYQTGAVFVHGTDKFIRSSYYSGGSIELLYRYAIVGDIEAEPTFIYDHIAVYEGSVSDIHGLEPVYTTKTAKAELCSSGTEYEHIEIIPANTLEGGKFYTAVAVDASGNTASNVSRAVFRVDDSYTVAMYSLQYSVAKEQLSISATLYNYDEFDSITIDLYDSDNELKYSYTQESSEFTYSGYINISQPVEPSELQGVYYVTVSITKQGEVVPVCDQDGQVLDKRIKQVYINKSDIAYILSSSYFDDNGSIIPFTEGVYAYPEAEQAYVYITQPNNIDGIIEKIAITPDNSKDGYYYFGQDEYKKLKDKGYDPDNDLFGIYVKVLFKGQWYGTKKANTNIKFNSSRTVIQAQKIAIDKPESTELEAGSKLQLTCTLEPEGAEASAINWTSSDPTIAAVSNKGLVTARRKPGTATITATLPNQKSSSIVITVKPAPIKATGLAIDQKNMTLSVGGTGSLGYKFSPANATEVSVTWTSSNEKIATVTAGVVKAVGAGKAVITARHGDLEASCTVTVLSVEDIKSVAIGKQAVTLKQTSATSLPSATLTATVMSSELGGIDKGTKLSWISSKPDVVKVTGTKDQTGRSVIVSMASGNVTDSVVTVTAFIDGNSNNAFDNGEVYDTCVVTVDAFTAALNSVTIKGSADGKTRPAARMKQGEIQELYAVKAPAAAPGEAQWTISNSSVLAFAVSGEKLSDKASEASVQLTAVGTGTATVTAIIGTRKNTLTITVSDADNGISSLGLQGRGQAEVYDLKMNETAVLVPGYKFAAATNRSVIYEINKEGKKVVSIKGNTLTALKTGTATVTARFNKTDAGHTITINVTEDQLTKADVQAANERIDSLRIYGASDIDRENELTKVDMTLKGTEALTVVPYFEDAESASTLAVNLKSSNGRVVTVVKGVLTAKGVGEATVTASVTIGSGRNKTVISKELAVKVTAPIEYVTLPKTELTLTAGTAQTLAATVVPASAAGRKPSVTYTWDEVNAYGKEVADADRKLALTGADTAKVKFDAAKGAKLGDKTYLMVTVAPIQSTEDQVNYYVGEPVSTMCEVTISKKASSVTITDASGQAVEPITLYTNPVEDTEQRSTFDVDAAAFYTDADKGTTMEHALVTWKSSNTRIASVTADGTITAVAPGKATITATSGGRSSHVVVTVMANVTTVTPASTDVAIALKAGRKGTATVKLSYDNNKADKKAVAWTVTDLNGEEVSEDTVSLVTSNAALLKINVAERKTGTYIVTGTCPNGAQTSIRVIVTDQLTGRTSTIFANSGKASAAITLAQNGTDSLKLELVDGQNRTYINADEVVWTSQKSDIATVDRYGCVTGHKPGKTVISATYGGKTIKCTVTVSKAK